MCNENAAPVLAAMIAGMREEWGVSHDGLVVEWSRDEALMRKRANAMNRRGSRPVRIVRRYVTEPEEA